MQLGVIMHLSCQLFCMCLCSLSTSEVCLQEICATYISIFFYSKDLLASDSEGEDVSDILGSTKKSTEPKSNLEIRQEKLK